MTKSIYDLGAAGIVISQDVIRLQQQRIDALRAALEHAARMKTIKGARVIVRDALDEDDKARGERR